MCVVCSLFVHEKFFERQKKIETKSFFLAGGKVKWQNCRSVEDPVYRSEEIRSQLSNGEQKVYRNISQTRVRDWEKCNTTGS